MPTLTDVTKAVVPVGMTLAQYLASQNGLNSATKTVQQGATTAAAGLNTAASAATEAQKQALAQQQQIAATSQANTGAASTAAQVATAAGAKTATIAQQEALAKQQGIYNTTVQANEPYSQTGLEGNKQLQELTANPNSLENTPGYQFELAQGLQGGQRAAAASGTLGNGGTIKAQTRYALDYANTKYNDAVNRLLQVTGVGERANAANQAAGNTYGSQIGTEANNVGNIATNAATETGKIGTNAATEQNAAGETLGQQTGTEATNVGNIQTQNAENQASLTLAQAQLAAKNQGLQANNTASTIGAIGAAVPTIANLFKTAAPAAAGAGAAGAGGAASVALPAGQVGSIAGIGSTAPATGLTGALGLGGGSGLLGLGAATIPVVGGIIAGGALLANHFIGEGRKAADKLTGEGGIQHAFEDTLNQIDAQPGYTDAQKWESKTQAYDKLKELGIQFAQQGKNQKKVASQMFDEISHLFGDTNPLKGAA